ncbi:MAG: trehalose-6-phosphate synthase [Dehalococcoidia bacterium]|nr:trehalose-6-phosphate synthase [Dehalococcoidia bacterium]
MAESPHAGRLRALASEMLAERRLIIASNRGPVEFALDEDGTPAGTRGSGGLVTALSAVARYAELTWIASAMTDGDRVIARREGPSRFRGPIPEEQMYLLFVEHQKAAYNRYYNVFSNPLLWFIQHYMWNTPRTPNINLADYEAWDEGYVPVNRAFADSIVREVAGDPLAPYVMAQDYQLYLVPGFVRESLPGAIIQHFVHIPWPDPRYWELLPNHMRLAIFESLAAADFVGLQTSRDTRNFLHSCEAILPGADIDYRRSSVWYKGRLTNVRAYPISIDVPTVEDLARSQEVEFYEKRLAPLLGDLNILRVDRMEPSKNIVRGFRAFELLLRRHPELRGRVNFLAFLVPSRQEIALYQTYTDDVFEIVDGINDQYGDEEWQPVRVFHENNYTQAIAAMKHYDVLLVNPVIDGMNLVSKEGPLVNGRGGVLILSEAAGSHEQLGQHAISVATADVEGTERALFEALTMGPDARSTRAAAIGQQIRNYDIAAWLESQFRDLRSLA